VTAPAAEPGGARRRFVAPPRSEVRAERFEHPLYEAFAPWFELLAARDWPSVEALDERLALPGKRLVAQDDALLADGLHYEQRIARGIVATRADNWHDLFNALVWARYPAIKQALNARQCERIAANGSSRRDRAQAALTQFDESGVIVRVSDAALLDAWNRHDWTGLFVHGAAAWRDGRIAIAAVVGHALMEQALLPGRLLVGKCIVVRAQDDAECAADVAQAIADGTVLNDPLELRPLPLMGIPGWHAQQDALFYGKADYFRPRREGRLYP
jgi:hypothetical protein